MDNQTHSTCLTISVEANGLPLGFPVLIADGTWELHRGPVGSNSWTYLGTADAVILSLCQWFTDHPDIGPDVAQVHQVLTRQKRP
jgi:hypothetical protein